MSPTLAPGWIKETTTHRHAVLLPNGKMELDKKGHVKTVARRETTYTNMNTGEQLIPLGDRSYFSSHTGKPLSRRKFDEHVGRLAEQGLTIEQQRAQKAAEGTKGKRTPRSEPAGTSGGRRRGPTRPQGPLPPPPEKAPIGPEYKGPLQRKLRNGQIGFEDLGLNVQEYLVPEALQTKLPKIGYYVVAQNFIYTLPDGLDVSARAYGKLKYESPKSGKKPGVETWLEVIPVTTTGFPDATFVRWQNMNLFEYIERVSVVWERPKDE